MKLKQIKLLAIFSFLLISTFLLSACSIKNDNLESKLENIEQIEKVEEVKIDLMTDAEKEMIGVDLSKDYQVLERGEDNLIMGYKPIENDEDLVTKQEDLDLLLNIEEEADMFVEEENVESNNVLEIIEE